MKNFAKKKQKNEKFQQSHSAEKSERRDPLGFLTFVLLQNTKKMKGGIIFGDMKKNCKKNHKAEITCTKYFGQGRDSNPLPSAWQTSNNPN